MDMQMQEINILNKIQAAMKKGGRAIANTKFSTWYGFALHNQSGTQSTAAVMTECQNPICADFSTHHCLLHYQRSKRQHN